MFICVALFVWFYLLGLFSSICFFLLFQFSYTACDTRPRSSTQTVVWRRHAAYNLNLRERPVDWHVSRTRGQCRAVVRRQGATDGRNCHTKHGNCNTGKNRLIVNNLSLSFDLASVASWRQQVVKNLTFRIQCWDTRCHSEQKVMAFCVCHVSVTVRKAAVCICWLATSV